jgi:hypothetical protein
MGNAIQSTVNGCGLNYARLADVWTYYPEIKLSMGILFDCISKALDQSPFIVIQRRFLTKRTRLIACRGEQKHFVQSEQSDIISHMLSCV